MIYIDANVFIYAFFNAKGRKLDPKTAWIKEQSKVIIKQINSSEPQNKQYCISILTLAEIMTTLKSSLSIKEIHQILLGIFSNPAIEVIEVPSMLFLNAIDKMNEFSIDANDIITWLIMDDKKISEIYSFDEHFRKFPNITMLPHFPKNFPDV